MGPSPSAYAQIGFNYNQQSDWENARIFLEKSVSIQPENIDTKIYLANTLANLGEMKKALELLQNTLNPNPAQSKAINKMIFSLTSLKNKTP